MKSVLLVCPNISGHRQNYMSVIANWFLSKNIHIFLAVDTKPNFDAPSHQMVKKIKTNNNVELCPLNVEMENINLSDVAQKFQLAIIQYERELKPDWTFFITGDELIDLLRGIKSNVCSSTMRIGLFIAGKHIYARDFRALPIFHQMKNKYQWRHFQKQQNKFFNKDIFSELALDRIILTNKQFYEIVKNPFVFYMPEIYRAFTDELSDDNPLIKDLSLRFKAFLNKNNDKDPIVYYGGWAARRGYDSLLKLAAENADSMFVSAGRPTMDTEFQYDVDYYKEILKKENRIFEVEIPFLPENHFIDMVFESSRYIILPYRNFYGLSGLLIQSICYGKPVLTPDIGYLGSVTRQFALGSIFRHGNYERMKEVWSKFRYSTDEYRASVLNFSKQFKFNRIQSALELAVMSQ